eukprot:46805_1
MGSDYGTSNGNLNSNPSLSISQVRVRRQLNVACYNVYYEGHNRQGTINAICDMDVDLLILQETNALWEDIITNNTILKSKYKHIRCVNDKWQEGGTILLTNHQIHSLDIIERYNKWWYAAHRFTLRLQNDNDTRLIQIYSIHLIAPYPPLNHKCSCCGIACCGDDKNELRLKEIQHFLNNEYYDSSLPTVVIGDFNCMDGPCHEYLNDSLGLLDSCNASKRSHRYWMCCRHKPYSWRGMLCKCCCCAPKLFDHIYFSSNDFDCDHSKVLEIGDSDHFPIYAKLMTRF